MLHAPRSTFRPLKVFFTMMTTVRSNFARKILQSQLYCSPRQGPLWNLFINGNNYRLPSSQRLFSNTYQNLSKSDDRDVSTQSILLYKRDASRSLFPRLLLLFTTFHSSYWLWYTLDFTPTINARNIESVLIDPTVGYCGLGLSILMSVGALLYPKSLIEEIRLAESGEKSVFLRTYSLPFVTPSSPKRFPIGCVVLDSHNDAMKVINEYHGDIRKLEGYIPLQADNYYVNYLLHFGENTAETEVKDARLLFQTIVPSVAGTSLPPVPDEGEHLRTSKKGKSTVDKFQFKRRKQIKRKNRK